MMLLQKCESKQLARSGHEIDVEDENLKEVRNARDMRKFVNREQIAFMNQITDSFLWIGGEMIKSIHNSKCISSGMLDLERSRAGRLVVGSLLPVISWTLVQIQTEAYILTLFSLVNRLFDC